MKVHVVPAWVARIKGLKELWTARMDQSDLPPIVMVGRAGRIEATVIAPRVDRDLGLKAAEVLAIGFEPDVLFFAVEICGKVISDDEPKPPPGQMQRELDAGSAEIRESILIFEAKQTGEVTVWELLYRGKKSSFEWLDFKERTGSAGGFVYDTLRVIATDEGGRQKQQREEIRQFAREMGIMPAEREAWHRSRGTLIALERADFHCWDYRDWPEGVEGPPLKTEDRA